MKKLLAIGLAIMLLGISSGAIIAQDDSIPAAGAAFVCDNVAVSTADAGVQGDWYDLLDEPALIKSNDSKDLVISFSAETMLGTDTRIDGLDEDTASAGIEIRVLVDDVEADPGAITYDSRLVELSGDLSHHSTVDGEFVPVIDPATGQPIDDHWIELWMDTKAAHSFDFVASNLDFAGAHEIMVQAKLNAYDGGKGKYTTYASIGHMSLVVHEVMLKQVN